MHGTSHPRPIKAERRVHELYKANQKKALGKRNSLLNFVSEEELAQPPGMSGRFSSKLGKKARKRKTPLVIERAKGKGHVLYIT